MDLTSKNLRKSQQHNQSPLNRAEGRNTKSDMAIQQSDDGPLRELALFSGIGGGILGGKLLGWRTVCGVERNAYCAAILAKRQNEGYLEPFPIWSDVENFDGKPWRGIVDVVSGGFPCQDISCAGRGSGLSGERSGLWSHMARIIGEVRPRFAFVENSPMLVTRGLDRVLGDLSEMGFDAKWGVVSAADAIWSKGHPCIDHERERIWIVGTNADHEQMQGEQRFESDMQWRRSAETKQTGMGNSGDASNANDARNEQGRKDQRSERKRIGPGGEPVDTHTQRAPTMTKNSAKNTGSKSQHERNTPPLEAVLGGSLNPEWCEWFQGFPIGWTDLQDLETLRF